MHEIVDACEQIYDWKFARPIFQLFPAYSQILQQHCFMPFVRYLHDALEKSCQYLVDRIAFIPHFFCKLIHFLQIITVLNIVEDLFTFFIGNRENRVRDGGQTGQTLQTVDRLTQISLFDKQLQIGTVERYILLLANLFKFLELNF